MTVSADIISAATTLKPEHLLYCLCNIFIIQICKNSVGYIGLVKEEPIRRLVGNLKKERTYVGQYFPYLSSLGINYR